MKFDKEKLKFWKKVRPEVSKEQEESNLGQTEEPKPKVTLKERWHVFIHGTEEKPRHPFSLVAKIYRWYLKTFRGYVDYITTMYDKNIDEIRCDKDLVKYKDIPREAVHVTGQKKTYHLDMDLPKRGFDVTKDFGFTASSAFNYMKNNAMNDAMVHDQDSYRPDIDKNKLLVICAVAFGIFLAFYFVVVPMYL